MVGIRWGLDPAAGVSPLDNSYGQEQQIKDLQTNFGIVLPSPDELMSEDGYLSVCRRDTEEERKQRLEVASDTILAPGPLNKLIPVEGASRLHPSRPYK